MPGEKKPLLSSYLNSMKSLLQVPGQPDATHNLVMLTPNLENNIVDVERSPRATTLANNKWMLDVHSHNNTNTQCLENYLP